MGELIVRWFATILCLFIAEASIASEYTMAPDGSYVGGDTWLMAPDGTYVGGETWTMAPDGTYVGGETWIMAPDGSYVGGESWIMAPDGSYVGDKEFPYDNLDQFIDEDSEGQSPDEENW
jgi:hypothetical protein